MTEKEIKKIGFERLKKLNILSDARKDFLNKKNIWISENFSKFPYPVLYSLKEGNYSRPEVLEALNKFKQKYPSLTPYHCILNFTEYGPQLSILFISEDDLEADENDLNVKSKMKDIMAYVMNIGDDTFDEFGYVTVVPSAGALKRVY